MMLQFDLWKCKACRSLFLFDFTCDRYEVDGDTRTVPFCCPVCGEEEGAIEECTNQGLKQIRRVFVDKQLLRNVYNASTIVGEE